MKNLIKTAIFLGVLISTSSVSSDSYCYDCTAKYTACISSCGSISDTGKYASCMRDCFSTYSHCLN